MAWAGVSAMWPRGVAHQNIYPVQCMTGRVCWHAVWNCVVPQALAPAARAAALQRHAPTLEALAAALVTRTELKPVALATATADARDLPEEKRLVSPVAALFGRLAGYVFAAAGRLQDVTSQLGASLPLHLKLCYRPLCVVCAPASLRCSADAA
jgi:hypothetical protein